MKTTGLERLSARAIREVSTGRYFGVLVNTKTQKVVDVTVLTYEDEVRAIETAHFLLIAAVMVGMGDQT